LRLNIGSAVYRTLSGYMYGTEDIDGTVIIKGAQHLIEEAENTTLDPSDLSGRIAFQEAIDTVLKPLCDMVSLLYDKE
jgi:hypothetical protein